jgi:hypothetical protein
VVISRHLGERSRTGSSALACRWARPAPHDQRATRLDPAQVHLDAADLLARTDIDVVDICTPGTSIETWWLRPRRKWPSAAAACRTAGWRARSSAGRAWSRP